MGSTPLLWDVLKRPSLRFSNTQITFFCVITLAIGLLCQLHTLYHSTAEDRFSLHPFAMYVYYMVLVSFGASVCITLASPEWFACVTCSMTAVLSVCDLARGYPDYPFKLLLRVVTAAVVFLLNGAMARLCYRGVMYCCTGPCRRRLTTTTELIPLNTHGIINDT